MSCRIIAIYASLKKSPNRDGKSIRANTWKWLSCGIIMQLRKGAVAHMTGNSTSHNVFSPLHSHLPVMITSASVYQVHIICDYIDLIVTLNTV